MMFSKKDFMIKKRNVPVDNSDWVWITPTGSLKIDPGLDRDWETILITTDDNVQIKTAIGRSEAMSLIEKLKRVFSL